MWAIIDMFETNTCSFAIIKSINALGTYVAMFWLINPNYPKVVVGALRHFFQPQKKRDRQGFLKYRVRL
jgi:hypothetical protein